MGHVCESFWNFFSESPRHDPGMTISDERGWTAAIGYELRCTSCSLGAFFLWLVRCCEVPYNSAPMATTNGPSRQVMQFREGQR